MKEITSHKKNTKVTAANLCKERTSTDSPSSSTKIQASYLLTYIRQGFFITAIVMTGIVIGLAIKFWVEPFWFTYHLPENFAIEFPVIPDREEVGGLPPFSERKIITYTARINENIEYTVLILEPATSGTEIDERLLRAPLINTDTEDAEISNWTVATIGILCADREGKIDKNCLQPGSRVTSWSAQQEDGRVVRGEIRRGRQGRIIQLLAAGVDDYRADKFFNSLTFK